MRRFLGAFAIRVRRLQMPEKNVRKFRAISIIIKLMFLANRKDNDFIRVILGATKLVPLTVEAKVFLLKKDSIIQHKPQENSLISLIRLPYAVNKSGNDLSP
jgi:hypothetical protein